jgi:hypothetical protein
VPPACSQCQQKITTAPDNREQEAGSRDGRAGRRGKRADSRKQKAESSEQQARSRESIDQRETAGSKQEAERVETRER